MEVFFVLLYHPYMTDKGYQKFQTKLAERIRDLRKKKGLTQEDMFAEGFMSARSYQDIETGKAAPRLRSIYAICKTLEVQPADLLNIKI